VKSGHFSANKRSGPGAGPPRGHRVAQHLPDSDTRSLGGIREHEWDLNGFASN